MGFQDPLGQLAGDRTRDRASLSVLYTGFKSHASAGGWAVRSAARRRRRRAPGPGLRAATTIPAWPPRPPPCRPSRPATYLSARAGRGPRFRWSGGGAGKTSLGPSAPYRLRLEARRERNKRAPLPAGAGHCATSSGRDGCPAGRRVSLSSLACPALRPLPSGLRAAAARLPAPARPAPEPFTAQAPQEAPPPGARPSLSAAAAR